MFADCESDSHPDYHQADLSLLDPRINTDLDILYSQSFQDFADTTNNSSWEVTPLERLQLAERIDNTTTNPLGSDYEQWDVALIFDFYTHGNTLYGGFNEGNFEYENNWGSWPANERNHVDVYLVPLYERDGCNPAFPTGCCRVAAGTTPAQFIDDDEDGEPEQCPGEDEYHDNSVQIWDHWGNRDNIADWQQASSVTFDHEFEHLLQAEYHPGGNDVGMLEFFASSAEYLGNPVYPAGTGAIFDDVCYDNTVVVQTASQHPNYPIWRSWATYLHQHFRAGPGISDDLLRVWNRASSRTLSSLPGILENSSYDRLGCSTCGAGYKGQHRLVTIEVTLAASERVEAAVSSIEGRLVRKLEGGILDVGANRVIWDGRNESGLVVPSGQYYYQVRGGAWEKTGKLFVIK